MSTIPEITTPIWDRVCRRFPSNIETIQSLIKSDPIFREICEDYDEMITWVERYCAAADPNNQACDHAREVILGLEDEIIQALEPEAGR